MNPLSRLSPRLNAIYELVDQVQRDHPYSTIWDCCCDHGYLGIKILANGLCEKMVFVDQLPHLIEQLDNKLAPFDTGRHTLIVADAGGLRLDASQHHLVILAGVGGDTSVDIVKSIKSNHPTGRIDYIFCPSSSKKTLREYLAHNEFGLLEERLVCDNKRYYEILLVKGKCIGKEYSKVSLSCGLWDEDNPDHQRYLKKINTPRGSKKPKRTKSR
jgi:tRNA (adenine22-N1)-methyltransferase